MTLNLSLSIKWAYEYYKFVIMYYICYLIYDVTTCCDTSEINEYVKIMIENQNNKRKFWNQRNVYISLHLKDAY